MTVRWYLKSALGNRSGRLAAGDEQDVPCAPPQNVGGAGISSLEL